MAEQIRGTVSEDPLAAAQAGFQLSIERVPFPALHLHDTSLEWTSFDGVLLKLMFGNQTTARITGSGVMVAPGVAIAARHVIDPELDRILDASQNVGFLTLALTPNGVDVWKVHQIFTLNDNDAVLLTLKRASAFTETPAIKQAILSSRLPAIGEAVAICGFVAETVDTAPSEGIRGRVHISQGLVEEHFVNGRDRTMLPGPCYSVSVGTPGGLSGGPVFDETGRLVGVLSTSFGPDADGLSFVSMITPILARRFTSCWPDGLVKEPTALCEYDPRLCEIERRDAVRVLSPDGWDYVPWS